MSFANIFNKNFMRYSNKMLDNERLSYYNMSKSCKTKISRGGNMEFKQLLKEKNMSQVNIAKCIGKTQSLVSQWVNGVCTPQPSDIFKLAEALNCSVEEIVNCFKEK